MNIVSKTDKLYQIFIPEIFTQNIQKFFVWKVLYNLEFWRTNFILVCALERPRSTSLLPLNQWNLTINFANYCWITNYFSHLNYLTFDTSCVSVKLLIFHNFYALRPQKWRADLNDLLGINNIHIFKLLLLVLREDNILYFQRLIFSYLQQPKSFVHV